MDKEVEKFAEDVYLANWNNKPQSEWAKIAAIRKTHYREIALCLIKLGYRKVTKSL